jgi:hypothetical protein
VTQIWQPVSDHGCPRPAEIGQKTNGGPTREGSWTSHCEATARQRAGRKFGGSAEGGQGAGNGDYGENKKDQERKEAKSYEAALCRENA